MSILDLKAFTQLLTLEPAAQTADKASTGDGSNPQAFQQFVLAAISSHMQGANGKETGNSLPALSPSALAASLDSQSELGSALDSQSELGSALDSQSELGSALDSQSELGSALDSQWQLSTAADSQLTMTIAENKVAQADQVLNSKITDALAQLGIEIDVSQSEPSIVIDTKTFNAQLDQVDPKQSLMALAQLQSLLKSQSENNALETKALYSKPENQANRQSEQMTLSAKPVFLDLAESLEQHNRSWLNQQQNQPSRPEVTAQSQILMDSEKGIDKIISTLEVTDQPLKAQRVSGETAQQFNPKAVEADAAKAQRANSIQSSVMPDDANNPTSDDLVKADRADKQALSMKPQANITELSDTKLAASRVAESQSGQQALLLNGVKQELRLQQLNQQGLANTHVVPKHDEAGVALQKSLPETNPQIAKDLERLLADGMQQLKQRQQQGPGYVKQDADIDSSREFASKTEANIQAQQQALNELFASKGADRAMHTGAESQVALFNNEPFKQQYQWQSKNTTASLNGDMLVKANGIELDLSADDNLLQQQGEGDRQKNNPLLHRAFTSQGNPQQQTASNFSQAMSATAVSQAAASAESEATQAAKTSTDANATLMHLRTPTQSPAWGKNFAQQVVWLKQQQQNLAEIRLNPLSMGPVKVSIRQGESDASIQIWASQSQTRDMIEQALPKLREMLEEAGVDSFDVDVRDFEQPEQQLADDQQSQPAQSPLAALESGDADAESASSIASDRLLDLYA